MGIKTERESNKNLELTSMRVGNEDRLKTMSELLVSDIGDTSILQMVLCHGVQHPGSGVRAAEGRFVKS